MSTAPMLELRGVNVWFPIRRGVFSRVSGHVRAVQDVNLAVREGEVVALVGESGCGKSTLARAILMLQSPEKGEVLWHGEEVYRLPPDRLRRVRRDIQIIFQDPYASLNPRLPVYQIVTEGLVAHGLLRKEECLARAESLLRDVGLGPECLYRYPHEFSGGQRQRICIARAISMQPKLVVCDEALSALDVSIQAQVINLLLELKDKYRLSYLFISHDVSVVRMMADRVAVMYLGRVVEEATADTLFRNPMHPYTRALLSVVPRVGGKRGDIPVLEGEMPSVSNPPPGCPFHTRCPMAFARCRAELPVPRYVDGHLVSCHLHDA